MTHRNWDGPSRADQLRAWITVHADSLACPELIAGLDSDLVLGLGADRQLRLLTSTWLASIGLHLHPDDPWITGVEGRYRGRRIGPRVTKAPTSPAASIDSHMEGAWWMPGTRSGDIFVKDFGVGRTDFWDVDLDDHTLGPAVSAATWMPMVDLEPVLLLAALHAQSLPAAASMMRQVAGTVPRVDTASAATSVWTVARWIACRVAVTTGIPPAMCWGTALVTAVDICEHANWQLKATLSSLADRMAARVSI